MGANSSRNVCRFAAVFREPLAPGYSAYGFILWTLDNQFMAVCWELLARGYLADGFTRIPGAVSSRLLVIRFFFFLV